LFRTLTRQTSAVFSIASGVQMTTESEGHSQDIQVVTCLFNLLKSIG